MLELQMLRCMWEMLWTRLGESRNQNGAITLEMALITGGLATLAIATIAVIVVKVTDATNKIPTGP